MVIILKYNKIKTDYLDELLKRNNVEYKYSLNEKEVLQAEKIILPNPVNVNSTYRKLNMTNMYSLLRMIQKPILGINDGSKLMCGILGENKCGLGFFEIDREITVNEDETEDNWIAGKIKFYKPSKLVKDEYENFKVYVRQTRKPKTCEYSTAVVDINNKSYSILFENNNYFGIELDYNRNVKLFEVIIANFLKL